MREKFIYLKFLNYILVLICVVNCNKHKENSVVKPEIVQIKKDTIPDFSKYITKEYVLGKFDYTKDSSFVLIPAEATSKTIYLRKEVWNGFNTMQIAATKDSVSFTIISGTRNFEHQKRIWNYKWNEKYKNIPPEKRALKILEYSSMPSTSRHHWGTDIDLNNLNNDYFSEGKGLKEYNWLVENASKFGFYQPYTTKENGRTGYYEEKWHWSYLPLSSIYLNYYNQHITYKDITDFEGSAFAKEIDIIKNYVNGINPELNK